MYGITDDSKVALQLLETVKNVSLYVIVARLTRFHWLQQFLHLHMAVLSRPVSLLHNFTLLYLQVSVCLWTKATDCFVCLSLLFEG